LFMSAGNAPIPTSRDVPGARQALRAQALEIDALFPVDRHRAVRFQTHNALIAGWQDGRMAGWVAAINSAILRPAIHRNSPSCSFTQLLREASRSFGTVVSSSGGEQIGTTIAHGRVTGASVVEHTSHRRGQRLPRHAAVSSSMMMQRDVTGQVDGHRLSSSHRTSRDFGVDAVSFEQLRSGEPSPAAAGRDRDVAPAASSATPSGTM
jgi:hypothetical protein